MPESKRWFASKTVWFNVLTIVVAIASYYGWTPNEALTSVVAGLMVAVSPFVNLLLRFITRKAIA